VEVSVWTILAASGGVNFGLSHWLGLPGRQFPRLHRTGVTDYT
jgi:hypothetical protein